MDHTPLGERASHRVGMIPMLKHTVLSTILLTACAPTIEPTEPTVTETDQAVINTCDPRNYPCDPTEPISNAICQIICEGDDGGGYGYCMEYNAVEINWCSHNPNKCMASLKCCSPTGDPLWNTRCVPGWLP